VHPKTSLAGARSSYVSSLLAWPTVADHQAGILPPPLTKPASTLMRDELYDLHMTRLARLSLHPNVYLKLLPPVVESKVETWYDDKKALDSVIKAYRESHLTSLRRKYPDTQSLPLLKRSDSTESSLAPRPLYPVLISDAEPDPL
jgi:hypothetical protein